MNCGLLGRKLGHSYSPFIHSFLGSYSYDLFEKEPDQIEEFLESNDFSCINVTIPYKKTVIPFCSELSDVAKKIGSVNTIIRKPDGSLLGHNTDYYGFSYMIKESGLNPKGKKVLVLGSGGASVTAQIVLREMNANVIVVSRSGENNYHNLDRHIDASIIVNCTPVGMYPDNGVSPVDLSAFPNLEGVLDMIYNPHRTRLLLDAEQQGLVAHNGLIMLVAQAKESAEWFSGRKIRNEIISEIHDILQSQMQNIVLIGMPGCGKSTIAKQLSVQTGAPYIDADAALEAFTGKSISEIFANEGETTFRQTETEVLRELGKKSGYIIATGGGCVTRQENYDLLHQNGIIFWIQRDLQCLAIDGRPLSLSGNLSDMYKIRRPLYEKFSDHIVVNDSTPEVISNKILKLIHRG